MRKLPDWRWDSERFCLLLGWGKRMVQRDSIPWGFLRSRWVRPKEKGEPYLPLSGSNFKACANLSLPSDHKWETSETSLRRNLLCSQAKGKAWPPVLAAQPKTTGLPVAFPQLQISSNSTPPIVPTNKNKSFFLTPEKKKKIRFFRQNCLPDTVCVFNTLMI